MRLDSDVVRIQRDGNEHRRRDRRGDGQARNRSPGTDFISSMPVTSSSSKLDPPPPPQVLSRPPSRLALPRFPHRVPHRRPAGLVPGQLDLHP